MRLYKLLKDLPTFKAGQLAYVSSLGNLMAGTPEEPEIADTGLNLMMYHKTTLDKFPEILTEWFEEIKEPVNSIHWKPKYDDWYFYISDHGSVCSDIWNDNYTDNKRLAFGFVYRTEEECKAALDRKLAEARLRKTSDFKPDWNNDNQNKWTVYYNHNDKELLIEATAFLQYPSAIYFDTYDSIEKSIKENKQDWLIYFGIEEWK